MRYAYIVRCIGAEKDADGNVTTVHCTYDPATRSGTAGADARKVKGNIHWLSAAHAMRAEVRLYDRLFAVPFPGSRNPTGTRAENAGAEIAGLHATVVAGDDDDGDVEPVERDWRDDLNPESKRTVMAYVEPALTQVAPEVSAQFERHGYFASDIKDHAAGKAVFNRTVTLKDSWAQR